MDNALLPIPAAGALLGYTGRTLGKSSIYKHIREGRLVAIRIGRRTFVTRTSVEELISAALAASVCSPDARMQGGA
jgi:hypothetical protein